MEKCGNPGCSNIAQAAISTRRPLRRRVVATIEFGEVPTSRDMMSFRCRGCLVELLPGLVQSLTLPDEEYRPEGDAG